MASVTHGTHHEKLGWYRKHCNHSIWDQFSEDQQESMLGDDLFAGHSVSLVLVSIVTLGLLLSAITLVAVLVAS